ncbi:flagellar assembly peptidoglycan hydrolase FlgJ [Paucibacter sp. M5-1]|uniref:flagellar assembly peptidoglycan hydrolase FlgJ n=1 Tax=Paucibacter sp. M5-1 TaxID=3015998 RepID=UPI0022B8E673|nr:flagellar assembly peptidoglycan hydrolase FlgJ [Paucibacter sp. M5-1]MCZ7884669.1 flagellar assembly peptidoglycan hydrolase FlgJ [Paucibacter sp. M5-1]
MLNADFKIGAGFPALPAGGAVRAGGEFSGLYRQLHGEVSQFIENGSGSTSTTPPLRAAALSPEGLWHQLQASGEPVENNAAAPSPSQQEFLREIAPLAEQAGQRLGVAPEVLAAHAALESGWGQKPIRRSDGSDSHNLFALKAGASWRGEVAEVLTTEYEQGAPSKRREGFRSYAGPAQAFNDFAQLLLNSPRYQAALQTGADAQAYGRALQQGGYATDPAYADKLAATAQRIKAGGR